MREYLILIVLAGAAILLTLTVCRILRKKKLNEKKGNEKDQNIKRMTYTPDSDDEETVLILPDKEFDDEETVLLDDIGVSVTLKDINHPERVIHNQIYNRLVIGRSTDCDIIIDGDYSISKVHCVIIKDDYKHVLYIEDCNSQNGTYLNRKKVSRKVRLRNGDRISIGQCELKILFTDY